MRYSFIIVFIFLVNTQLNATIKYWVGTAGAAYSTPSSWSLTSGGSGGAGATSADSLVFNSNATVTINTGNTIRRILVTNNATVTLSNGSTTTNLNISNSFSNCLTIDFGSKLIWACAGTISLDFNIDGYAEVAGTLEINGLSLADAPRLDIQSSSRVTIKSTGVLTQGANTRGFAGPAGPINGLILESGAIFESFRDAGCTILDGLYDVNSTIKLNGNYTGGVTGFTFNGFPNVSIGNMEYNPPLQTGNINLTTPAGTLAAPYIIKGNFKILNTNGNELRFCSGSNSFLQINGNLEISPSSKFSLTGGAGVGNVYLKKDLINDGEITENGGATTCSINFNGTLPQNISSNGTFTNAVSMAISNTTGVTAITDINLSTNSDAIFTLIAGNIDLKTNNNILFVRNPATAAIVGGSINSHIIGKLKRATNSIATYAFPVCDNNTEFANSELETSTLALTNFQVEFLRPNPNYIYGLPNDGIEIVANYYWDIQRTLGTSDATVRLFYNGLSPNYVLIPSQLKVVHFNAALLPSPGLWENKGGVQNVNVSTTSSMVCTLFSPYTLGGVVGTLNSNENSLVYFNAQHNQNQIDLNWLLTSLNNYDYFEVLKSNDGLNFSIVEKVKAVEFVNNFKSIDHYFDNKKTYYKLKMVTKSGLVSFSKIIIMSKLGNDFSFEIYPKITQSQLNIKWITMNNLPININIYNSQGMVIYNKKLSCTKGTNNYKFNIDFLSNGNYFISLKTKNNKQTLQFIKE